MKDSQNSATNNAATIITSVSQPISRENMAGKPVLQREARTVLTLPSIPFGEKHLCDSITLNLGDACPFSCSFCYVGAGVRKYLQPTLQGHRHGDVVVRRKDALIILRGQLTDSKGRPRYNDPDDARVVYSSTLTDCAANLVLAAETVEACKIIFEMTHWEVRLLTKSNLLPWLVQRLPEKWHHRLLLGVSTGTLNDQLACAFETGTALPSKRLQSLHWLQDRGFRTFGMICPSLPQADYLAFAQGAAEAIRVEKCEHVWAEVINVRGESFTRTHQSLLAAGFVDEARRLASVSTQMADTPSERREKQAAWETYARETFMAHAHFIPNSKLKFLQYVTKTSRDWWHGQKERGAVLLGAAARLDA